MSEESNDVEIVEIEDTVNLANFFLSTLPDKPIMQLFQRLIGNDNKQNTVLTNSQILAILQKEFHIETATLHELEVDIYLSVMKKFLKDWPQWDDFDVIINELRSKNDTKGMKNVLEKKYFELKDYLKVMLEAAEPLAKETVKNVEETIVMNNEKPFKDDNDVVMEIKCTRAQLNTLINRYPGVNKNDSVFVVPDNGPSQISVHSPTFESLLNWFDIIINFNTNGLFLRREMKHELRHKLVNKNLNCVAEITPLYLGFQEKVGRKPKDVSRSDIEATIKAVRSTFPSETSSVANTLLDVISNDLKNAPENLKVPCFYRRYMNRFPYVRYLYADEVSKGKPSNKDQHIKQKYDLQLEETVAPMVEIYIGKVEAVAMKIPNNNGVWVECVVCKVKFTGVNTLGLLRQHIVTNHPIGPYWTCTNCKLIFSMLNVSNKNWHHDVCL